MRHYALFCIMENSPCVEEWGSDVGPVCSDLEKTSGCGRNTAAGGCATQLKPCQGLSGESGARAALNATVPRGGGCKGRFGCGIEDLDATRMRLWDATHWGESHGWSEEVRSQREPRQEVKKSLYGGPCDSCGAREKWLP
jgi:hypothetical protein